MKAKIIVTGIDENALVEIITTLVEVEELNLKITETKDEDGYFVYYLSS